MRKNKTPPLILASTSRYRAGLLCRLGVPFMALDPRVDESEFKQKGLSPLKLAQTLAWMKARAVQELLPDAVIIGGDQVSALGATVLGKPGTRAAAEKQLKLQQGKSHRLVTAIAVLTPKRTYQHADVTDLTMHRLSAAEIRDYVRRDLPLDCAGSYKIEASGISLLRKIKTSDFTAIEGMPLLWLGTLLRQLGLAPAP